MRMNIRGRSVDLANVLPLLALIVIWAVMPAFLSTRFWLNIFIIVFVKCIASVSLRTLGLSGNSSFAHGAFMGIGAYTAGILANFAGLPPYLTIPLGALAAMIIGVLTGLPFIRLRSIYFLMASMFLGVAIVYIISALKITGGVLGLKKIPGIFAMTNMKAYYYFFFALAVVSCAAMYRFESSRIGTTLRAIAQSPAAATAMGVNETFYRIIAVGVGCFFAGLSGAAFAHYNSSLSPNSFGMGASIWLIMYIMIGGHFKFIGPILGTIILVIIPEASRAMNQYAPFITVVVMLLVAYLLPGGLSSIPGTIKNTFRKRRQRREKKALTSAERGE